MAGEALNIFISYSHRDERLKNELVDLHLKPLKREGKINTWQDRDITAGARAVENYYWPLGSTPTRETEYPRPGLASFNRQQSEDAQSRIKAAYTELEQAEELPEQITARANAIAQVARVSQQTLYNHRSLWHPNFLQGVMHEDISLSAVESEPNERLLESPEPLKNKELHPIGENMRLSLWRETTAIYDHLAV
jgi:hypothetical protein